jgi:hypothetical protein
VNRLTSMSEQTGFSSAGVTSRTGSAIHFKGTQWTDSSADLVFQRKVCRATSPGATVIGGLMGTVPFGSHS